LKYCHEHSIQEKTSGNTNTTNGKSVVSSSASCKCVDSIEIVRGKEAMKCRIKILADSHGRGIRQELEKLETNADYSVQMVDVSTKRFSVESTIKPNANTHNIIKDVKSMTQDLNKSDFIFVMAGTNDLGINTDVDKMMVDLESSLKDHTHTNIIVSHLPYRYDEPTLNMTVEIINSKLKLLEDKYDHIKLLPLDFLRMDHYTYRGLHLNKLGKKALSKRLVDIIDDMTLGARIPVLVTNRNTFLGM
jgi:hypothetical protein